MKTYFPVVLNKRTSAFHSWIICFLSCPRLTYCKTTYKALIMAADIASLISFVRGVRQMMPVLVVLVWLFLRLRVLPQFMGSMLVQGMHTTSYKTYNSCFNIGSTFLVIQAFIFDSIVLRIIKRLNRKVFIHFGKYCFKFEDTQKLRRTQYVLRSLSWTPVKVRTTPPRWHHTCSTHMRFRETSERHSTLFGRSFSFTSRK